MLTVAFFNCSTIDGVFLYFGAAARLSPARRFLNWMPTIYKLRAAIRIEILANAKGVLHDVL